MKRFCVFFLSFVVFALAISCTDCDDCLDLQQKNILIQDAQGNNLLFGESAIFDPSTVTVSTANEPPQELFSDDETQTLLFFLQEDQTTYTLRFDENTSAILMFELRERKSERCCGNQLYSTTTLLNGQEVDNADTILIVP